MHIQVEPHRFCPTRVCQVYLSTPLVVHKDSLTMLYGMHQILTLSFLSFRHIESINIAASNLIQEKKRHAMHMALAANHSTFEIVSFLKVARSEMCHI